MKKGLIGLLVMVLVFSMVLATGSQTASANPGSGLAPGNWQYPSTVTGTEISVSSSGAPSYMQLLTTGIKLSGPALLCHPFTGGMFNWVGEIRQLKDKKWIKLTTTNAKVPNTDDGVFSACANVPGAGTYALFAAYQKVAAVIPGTENSSSATEGSGKWNTGTGVSLNLNLNPTPDGLQLFSTGIKVTKSVQLCYPFSEGQSGWVPEIRELKNGKWIKLTTTASWVPSTEGQFMACAKAPVAGIYALFGFLGK